MIERFSLVRLTNSYVFKPFDCTKPDLNDFLFNDAKGHLAALLAVTYILENDGEIIAYYSVLNDSIRQSDLTRGKQKRLFRSIPYPYKSHPSVKIGRFAVSTKYQSQGIGTEIMNYIKGHFIDKNKTGCRFITVDADSDPRTLRFYERNGFAYLTESDKTDPSRLMWFDLYRFTSYMNVS